MVVFVTVQKKRFAFFPALYFAVGFAACMYVRYAMDSSAYTMYGILLMILSFTMYSFDFGHLRKDEYSNITDKSRKTVLISVIVLVILGVPITIFIRCGDFLPIFSIMLTASDIFIGQISL